MQGNLICRKWKRRGIPRISRGVLLLGKLILEKEELVFDKEREILFLRK